MSIATKPTWLITGTSAGLGLALGQFVLEQGHNLVSVSRHEKTAPVLLEIQKNSTLEQKPALYHLTWNLATPDEDGLRILINKFLDENSQVQINVLVNNAAVASFHPLETFPSKTLHHTFQVNFFSPLCLIQTLLPRMRSSAWKANQQQKVIVNISSTQGPCADASELAYDSSKHALESMSGTLAAEVAPFGIRVMVVNFGSLRTAFATSGDRNELYPDISKSASNDDDPYADPKHPVNVRMTMCQQLANTPGLARADVHKASRMLFSGVMRHPRSMVEKTLEQQRSTVENDGTGKGRVERLALGADGYVSIEREVNMLQLQVESCRQVVAMADCDDLL